MQMKFFLIAIIHFQLLYDVAFGVNHVEKFQFNIADGVRKLETVGFPAYSSGNATPEFELQLLRNLDRECSLNYDFGAPQSYEAYPYGIFQSFPHLHRISDLLWKVYDDRDFKYFAKELTKAQIPWIAITAAGVLLIVLSILSTCLLCKCTRKCFKCLTCGFCCKDRLRQPLHERSTALKYCVGVWFIIFGVIGMIIGAVTCLNLSSSFRSSYSLSRCDLEKTVEGLLYGANSTGDLPYPENDWIGVNYYYDVAKNVKDVVLDPTNGTLHVEMVYLADVFQNETKEATSEASQLLNDTSATIKHVETSLLPFNHHSIASAETRFISEFEDIMEKVSNGTTKFEDSLTDQFNSTALDGARGTLETIETQVANVTDSVEEYYLNYHQEAAVWADYTVFWIQWGLAIFGLIGLLVSLFTCVTYAFLLCVRPSEGIDSGMRNAFACNYCCLIFFCGLCVSMSGVMFFAFSPTSAGCNILTGQLLHDGQWAKLNMASKTTEILDECASQGGSGNFLQFTGLSDELQEVEDVFGNLTQSAEKQLHDLFNEVQNVSKIRGYLNLFTDLSWVVLPKPIAVMDTKYPYMGNQVYDAQLNCTELEALASSPLPICSRAATRTVYGLTSLNNQINVLATRGNWCMDSLKNLNIRGCSGAIPSPVIITSTTDTTSGPVKAEYDNLVATQSVAAAQLWLNYVKLGKTKEAMKANEPFICPTGPATTHTCSIMSYAPYIDEANSTLSPFAAVIDSNIVAAEHELIGIPSQGQNVMSELNFVIENKLVDPLKTGLEHLNCAFVGFSVRRLSNHICFATLPSLASYPIGLMIMAGCSILLVPLSFKLYHFSRDSIVFEEEEEETKEEDGKQQKAGVAEEGHTEFATQSRRNSRECIQEVGSSHWE